MSAKELTGMSSTVVAHFVRKMAELRLPPDNRIAVSLSGGPDSMALAALVAWWSGASTPPPAVQAQLHALRAESDAGAAGAARAQSARTPVPEAAPLSWAVPRAAMPGEPAPALPPGAAAAPQEGTEQEEGGEEAAARRDALLAELDSDAVGSYMRTQAQHAALFRPWYDPTVYPSATMARGRLDPAPGDPQHCLGSPRRRPPIALIVDHALRQESAEEAAGAAAAARALGLTAFVKRVKWGRQELGVISAELARSRRFTLLRRNMDMLGVGALLVAHNSGDQAETFLLRVTHASGVDGLSGMREYMRSMYFGPSNERNREHSDKRIVRPLLGVTAAALRAFCVEHGLPTAQDPSNVDLSKRSTPLSTPALSGSDAGESDPVAEGQRLAALRCAPGGGCVLDVAKLAGVPEPVGFRALSAIIYAIGGHRKLPHTGVLSRVYRAMAGGHFKKQIDGAGCRIAPLYGSRFAVAEFLPQKMLHETGEDEGAPDGMYLDSGELAAERTRAALMRAWTARNDGVAIKLPELVLQPEKRDLETGQHLPAASPH
ncbi:hypothetical protein WJX81_006359 [Elliptochloris bilobata]|uniref:tRNA(Ile)-lysidine synthetase n=1 Tax=Elliptochloris bilobata TaxID=381761 RepID=A0AAW1S135_9CHLO